jgi:hypothetical protein
VDQLGPNALGEVLEPGRVADCYLGLLLPPGPAGEPEAGTILIVAPAALLHPRVPQPDGSLVYALLTGHPEREAGELVFVADLTGELRAWPHDTWAKLGVDPDQVTQAVVGCWQDGEVTGLQVDGLGFRRNRRYNPIGAVLVGADAGGEMVEVPEPWVSGAVDWLTTTPTEVLAHRPPVSMNLLDPTILTPTGG